MPPLFRPQGEQEANLIVFTANLFRPMKNPVPYFGSSAQRGLLALPLPRG
jgi:hypothetical protein